MSAIERRALAKISWRLLPFLGLGYGIAYMDRTNIGFAALQMSPDLGFSPSVYGLGAGLFFLTYAALEIPSNLALVRFGARRWIARIMITWGIIAVGMMFVRSAGEFYLVRLLLGGAEAGFFPGVLAYLMNWFPRYQRARAMSRFYIALPLSTAVMGSLAGLLLGMNGIWGLRGWQWLFLIEGGPAIFLGVAILWLLPERPADASWLDASERAAVTSSLVSSQTVQLPAYSFWATIRQPAVLLLSAINFINLAGSYSFALSAPTLIRNVTHLDASATGYVIAAVGLLGALAMLGAGWHSDYHQERYLHIIVLLLMLVASCLMMALSQTGWAFTAAYAVMWCALVAFQTILFVLPADILQDKAAAVAIAVVNTIGMTGAFAGPYLWGLAVELTGGYSLGLVAIALLFAGAIPPVFALRKIAWVH